MKMQNRIVTRALAPNTIVMILAGLLFSACSILPEQEPVDLFQLPVSTITNNSTTFIGGGLRVLTPDSSDAISGSRLLILDDNTFQAWPGSRWAASIPQLWRDWLVDALWRDGRFIGISTDSTVLQAERSINGMLRAMHTENLNGRMTAIIRFDAQLIATNSRTIIASQRFEARTPVNGNSAGASVTALGIAADQLARELIDWAAENSN